MGKWLALLRENSSMLQVGTDRTDKTPAGTVLSVSSVPPSRVSQDSAQSQSHIAGGSVSSPAVRSANFHDPADRAEWDDEDWQAAFEERAAILEFDENLLRHEAENLARIQIESQRKNSAQ